MSPAQDIEANTKLVIGHFEDFVNNKDLSASIEIWMPALSTMMVRAAGWSIERPTVP